MPAKRPRVAAYLPESLYEKFKEFARENQLGDSQALIKVLSDRFEVALQVSHSDSLEMLERIEQLEASLTSMRSDMLSELKQVVLAELAPHASLLFIPPSRVESEAVSIQPEVVDVLQVSDSPQDTQQALVASSEELPIVEDGSPSEDLPLVSDIDKIFLTGGQLRRRLKAADSTMSNKRNSSSDVFALWSAKLDPNGLSWMLNSDGKFSPVGDIPPEVKAALFKAVPSGLSNAELAKRLKMDGSTLSHWKKDKSSEEFLRDVRAKDPEGMGWSFNSETKRFIPDSSGSPCMTQSELPGIVSPESDEF
jgi:hypothetical protein